MKKLAIVISCILIFIIGVFAYAVNHKDTKAKRITPRDALSRSETSENKPIQKESVTDETDGLATDEPSAVYHETQNGERPRPEFDPSSPYYINSDARKKLFDMGLFSEASMDKIFELRRKMIDRNLDSKKMSADLKKKIQSSPNGKLSREEILSLLPEDLASDFEEMVKSNRANK